MSDWYDNQKRPAGNFHKLMQERINNTHFNGKLNSEDSKYSSKLEAIKGKLRSLDEVQNTGSSRTSEIKSIQIPFIILRPCNTL